MANCHPNRKHHAKGFCAKCYQRDHHKRNAQRISEYHKRRYRNNFAREQDRKLRRSYGITIDDYKRLRIEQKDCCAICGNKPKTRLVVDHCHTSGKARALLCDSCNRWVGILENPPDLSRHRLYIVKWNEVLGVSTCVM